MQTKTIEINGTRFVFVTSGDEVAMTIIGTAPGNRVAMTKEQCSTLGDVLKGLGK